MTGNEINVQTIMSTIKEIDKRSSYIFEQANVIRQRLHGMEYTPMESTNTDNINDELMQQLIRLNIIFDIMSDIQNRI